MKSQALLQSDNQMKKNKRNYRGCKISGQWIRSNRKENRRKVVRKQSQKDSAAGHQIPARALANPNKTISTNKTQYAKTLARMQTKGSQVHRKAARHSVNSFASLRNHENYKS